MIFVEIRFGRSTRRSIVMPYVLVKPYLQQLTRLEYSLILLLAKPSLTFDISQGIYQRNIILTLQIMKIAPA